MIEEQTNLEKDRGCNEKYSCKHAWIAENRPKAESQNLIEANSDKQADLNK